MGDLEELKVRMMSQSVKCLLQKDETLSSDSQDPQKLGSLARAGVASALGTCTDCCACWGGTWQIAGGQWPAGQTEVMESSFSERS